MKKIIALCLLALTLAVPAFAAVQDAAFLTVGPAFHIATEGGRSGAQTNIGVTVGGRSYFAPGFFGGGTPESPVMNGLDYGVTFMVPVSSNYSDGLKYPFGFLLYAGDVISARLANRFYANMVFGVQGGLTFGGETLFSIDIYADIGGSYILSGMASLEFGLRGSYTILTLFSDDRKTARPIGIELYPYVGAALRY